MSRYPGVSRAASRAAAARADRERRERVLSAPLEELADVELSGAIYLCQTISRSYEPAQARLVELVAEQGRRRAKKTEEEPGGFRPGATVRLFRHGDGSSLFRIVGKARRGADGRPRWKLEPLEPEAPREDGLPPQPLSMGEEWLEVVR